MAYPASHSSRPLILLELLFASALWGFGFVATRWALESYGPLWIQAIRSFVVVVVALPFFFGGRRPFKLPPLSQFYLAATPGLFLGASLIFQTYGLKYTTVTKSGFITCLYVVFVPLFETTFRKQSVRPWHLLFVFVALLGTGFMSGVESGDWNVGDLMTLACSLCAAVQIISLGALAGRMGSSFQFNVFQSFWAGLIPLCLAVPLEPIHWFPIQPLAAAGIVFLAVGSSLIGFMIQIRAQKVISPSVVSVFLLLEGPFAALFAFLLFGEHMNPIQWVGALLIFVAAMGTALLSRSKMVH